MATTAGDLHARHVIHAAVMGADLRTDLPTVAATTRSVLDLADGMGRGSLAMPLLGTGVGGLDLVQVASTMVAEVGRCARDGRCEGMTVMLVGFDDEAAGAVVSALEGFSPGDS